MRSQSAILNPLSSRSQKIFARNRGDFLLAQMGVVGADNIRYENIAFEVIQDFQRFLTLNYYFEGDAVTQAEAFCSHLSAELTAELLQEVNEAKKLKTPDLKAACSLSKVVSFK